MKSHEVTRRTFIGKTAGAAVGAVAGVLATSTDPWESQAAVAPADGMPQLSACIEAVFRKAPLEQRIEMARQAGLPAIEFWGWDQKKIDAIGRKKDELGLAVAIFSCKTGGAMVAPGSDKGFVEGVKQSIAAAKQLGCTRVIATVGQERKDISRDEQHKNIVTACKAGAPVLEDAGITLCLEPLNVLVNHKGYYLASSKEAFDIVDEVGSPNVKILFDIYHQQITEGNVIRNATQNIQKIGHFHVADVPGRHEPGTGEINYFNVFRAIAKAGYNGYLGLEMWPEGDDMAAVRATKNLFDEAVGA